jgi:cold shock protein
MLLLTSTAHGKNATRFEMPIGKVSHYDAARGFGFIVRDDGGADVFCHANHILNADLLKKGQAVSFEIVMDERRGKLRADSVRVLDEDRCAALARAWPDCPPLITAKF